MNLIFTRIHDKTQRFEYQTLPIFIRIHYSQNKLSSKYPSRLGQAEDNQVKFLTDFLTDEHGTAIDHPWHLKEGGTVLIKRQLALLAAYTSGCCG